MSDGGIARPHLLSASEVAEVLGCSARSVLRQAERGRYPYYRPSPRRVVFDLEAVLAAIREGSQ